jgi:hypothetical protein
MVHSGPRDPADRVISDLPRRRQIRTLPSHGQHSATSSDELTILICSNSSTKHGCARDSLRFVEALNHITAANITGIALGRAHHGDRSAFVENRRRTKRTSRSGCKQLT